MVLVCFSIMEFGGGGGRSCESIDHQEKKIVESPKRTKSRMPRNWWKKEKDLQSHVRRAMKTHITHVAEKYSVHVVVQFHPWFKFYFLCFKRIVIHVHYHTQKQNKIKFKPRMQYYWTATYTYTTDDQLGETPQ